MFFVLVYLVSFGFISLLFKIFYKLALKREQFRNKDYLYAAVLAFLPVMILMARSFGAVTPWTVSLIAVFLFLTEFLVYKRI